MEAITVCAACDRVSCWLGDLCEEGMVADVRRITREEFDRLGLEPSSVLDRLREAEEGGRR